MMAGHKFCKCGRILTLEEMRQGDKCQSCKDHQEAKKQ